ncbi:hypothetical protein MAQ5080_01595 [Marinomonas aquimarina]|uniref:DUF3549 domain-containing protein n=1 Tax=Marinomonas aquimarina TaxID=295068 RepID=A0A1A8TB72_9GAMM|nr:DUF3549 family protein [Marinomonas aquimarina]SBS30192.1 hypothetical protein MAQ5080_01595 [Marinomonas aquimarina]
MQNIESLSDLFSAVGCKASFYDVGRYITKITPQQVIQFDKKQQVYPYGFRKQAWLACVLTEQQAQTNDGQVVWFLRLPLDESGCLNLGARDHFIKTIVDKILHKGAEQGVQEALEDNPYAFQPDQDRLASFHAILARDLKQPPSQYFSAVLDYLKGDDLHSEDTWNQLGIQGLADLAARNTDKSLDSVIVTAIEQAPNEVRFPLCHALEHHVQSDAVVKAVCEQMLSDTVSTADAAHFVRAIARTEFVTELFIPLFTMLGDISHCDDEQLELIASLVAKCPHWVAEQGQLLRIILEKLAHRDDSQLGFKHIVAELTQQPETRTECWHILRSDHASQALQNAVANLFTPASSTLQ